MCLSMSTRAQTRQSFNSRKLELRSKKTINKTTWTRFQCSKMHDILAALKQDGGFSETTSMKGSPWSKDCLCIWKTVSVCTFDRTMLWIVHMGPSSNYSHCIFPALQ
ncbi:hypothetical protein ACOMHN_019395 [Nucella lapillus]